MKVSKLKSGTPKVLQPKNIRDLAKFLQTQFESGEINDIGSVKIIPPAKIKFKPVTGSCVLPKVERQTVEYIKKEDEIPSLIEMNFEKLGEMTLDQFKKMEKKITSNELDEIEDAVWSNLITRCTQRKGPNPVYATEWTESRIDDKDKWNINGFTEKHSILNMNTKTDRIPGVQSSFVIVGMQGAWFCAHKEDNDLGSINILLEGAEKIWYTISHKYAEKFEKLFKHLLGNLSHQLCDTVLRHKCFIIAPWVLAKNGIEYTKHIQRPGEVMLTMYGAYHFGFNTGFNVCEAANLASPKFFDFYPKAQLCEPSCWLHNRTNATKIKLGSLLQKYKQSIENGSTSIQKHRHTENDMVLQSVQPKSKKKYTENSSTSTKKQRQTEKVKVRKSIPPKPEKETSKDDPLYLHSVGKTDDLKSTYRQKSKKARHECPEKSMVLQSVQPKSKEKYTENSSTSTKKQRHTEKVKVHKSIPPKTEKETSKDDRLYLLSTKKLDYLKSTYRQKSKKARHECPKCHSSFGRPSNLARHQRIYHDSLVNRFKCSACNFVSLRQQSVINHQQKEHEETENMCVEEVTVKNPKQKQQKWLLNLLKPAKRTYIRKVETCIVCAKVLQGKSSLKRHMMLVHKVENNGDEIL